jgi:ribose 5-phosphate isomerase RpiB
MNEQNLYPAGKVYLGADEVGFEVKGNIKDYLEILGYLVIDLGVFDIEEVADVPTLAREVAEKVLENTDACTDSDDHDSHIHGCAAYGILINSTGVGMLMSVSKLEGIHAVLCANVEMAEDANSKKSNVLCLGIENTNFEQLKEIIKAFLK